MTSQEGFLRQVEMWPFSYHLNHTYDIKKKNNMPSPVFLPLDIGLPL